MAHMNPDDPIEAVQFNWPTAELDPIARMRALVAALPHAASDETVFDVPFDTLWSFIEDLETNVPQFENAVGRLRIVDREGERLKVDTRSPMGIPMRFDVVLKSGWCLMSSTRGQIGMAAHPLGETRTRFFHFERSARLSRVARPFFAWNIQQDFRKIRSLLDESS